MMVRAVTAVMAVQAAEEAVALMAALVMAAMVLVVVPALVVTLVPVVIPALVAVLAQGRVMGCSSQSAGVSTAISRMPIRLLLTLKRNSKRYLISTRGLLIQN